MKKIGWLLLALLLSLNSLAQKNEVKEHVVLAYVTSWSSIVPDPAYITHINYAFGHVNETFNGVRIDNGNRLKMITGLKKQHPNLKVLLSIGGWGSGRFSEMAANESYRKAFAKDCERVVKEFNLDGIDIDWEFPTTSMANISSSPEDTDNFTLLMRDIRKAIGSKKLLTLATQASGKYIDFPAIDKYIDFVNIMTYDMNNPPKHHASLYRSDISGWLSAEESVDAHIKAGVPVHKLTLGMPFYGRAKGNLGNFINYKQIVNLTGYTDNWDDVAKAPYLTDTEGEIVCTYETPRSIAHKCEFLLKKGMLGAMYWDYDGDDANGTLRKAVYNGVMKK